MLTCTKLRKKVCMDHTPQCEWIINKGCKKNITTHNNVPIFTKECIKSLINIDEYKGRYLNESGYKAMSDIIHQFCTCIFAQELDEYDSFSLQPFEFDVVDSDFLKDYKKFANLYAKQDTHMKDDLKKGTTIEKIFRVKIKNDASMTFLIGGLTFLIKEILNTACASISPKKVITSISIARAVSNNQFSDALIINSKEEILRKKNEMSLKFFFYSKNGKSVFAYQNRVPPYMNIRTNLYKSKLLDVQNLLKSYNLKQHLSNLNKKELIQVILPHLPQKIQEDTRESNLSS